MNNFDLKKFLAENKLTKDAQIIEGLDEGSELTAADVAAIAGDKSLIVYKKSNPSRMFDYENAQEFLKLFAKHEPDAVYKQERPRVFVATEKPVEPGKGYTPSAAPAKADYTSYYAKKGSGGFTGD